ncbi:hypothetical protein LVY75_04475 (plasmid) [Sinorhizobium sp. B11]
MTSLEPRPDRCKANRTSGRSVTEWSSVYGVFRETGVHGRMMVSSAARASAATTPLLDSLTLAGLERVNTNAPGLKVIGLLCSGR